MKNNPIYYPQREISIYTKTNNNNDPGIENQLISGFSFFASQSVQGSYISQQLSQGG